MASALAGWRLIPKSVSEHDSTKELIDLAGYIAELVVPKGSPAIDRMVRDLDAEAEEADAVLLGLVRNGKRLPGRARTNVIRSGDILVVEAAPDGIDRLKGALKLEAIGEDRHEAAAGAGSKRKGSKGSRSFFCSAVISISKAFSGKAIIAKYPSVPINSTKAWTPKCSRAALNTWSETRWLPPMS